MASNSLRIRLIHFLPVIFTELANSFSIFRNSPSRFQTDTMILDRHRSLPRLRFLPRSPVNDAESVVPGWAIHSILLPGCHPAMSMGTSHSSTLSTVLTDEAVTRILRFLPRLASVKLKG